MTFGIYEGNICGITSHQGEEPDRIPDDDMGEVNGKNIEDEATLDVLVAEIDVSVWYVISSMVKWPNVYPTKSMGNRSETR